MEEITICWSLTSICNMNCYYCFAKYDSGHKAFHMTNRLIDVTLHKIREASKKYSIRLVILGGEPTLHPRLQSICEDCLSFCRKVIVVTNGTNVRTINSLPKEVSVDLSYHGQVLSEFYALINEVRTYHFTQILCVLDKTCQNDIIQLHEWCMKNNLMFEAIPLVDNETEIAETYDDSFLERVKTNVFYKIPMFNEILTNVDVYRKNKNNKEDKTFFYCKQSNIAIYSNGYYYPCCKSGLLNNKHHIEEDNHSLHIGNICKQRYCMMNRGCLDFAGWRQDPDGFFPWNHE